MALASLIGIDSSKPENGKENASVEGDGDGNGQVPPGQTEDGDGNIVNNDSNMAPGLNRGEHIDKPANPNKPDKPENPGTEDKDDKRVNKANSGTHIYTCDELNRMVFSSIAKVVTNYIYDTLDNLAIETVKNESLDYEYGRTIKIVDDTSISEQITKQQVTVVKDAVAGRVGVAGLYVTWPVTKWVEQL